MTARAASQAALELALRGRYELRRKLGAGGFGDVYEALQRTTGQRVAIKVLRCPEDDPPARLKRLIARFEREMQLCAQLHHPNIVRLVDSGHAEENIVYSVFEFVPGTNLAKVLAAEQRLLPAEARHLLVQVLDALACAHAQGVVHRDLKPENIMIVPTGARRNAVVLDFGIGAFTEGTRRGEGRITQTDEWVGTPLYAAPEQLRRERPAPRSDLYAWGLVFLECLTGERPVRGSSVADVIFKQLSAEPIPIPPWLAAHPLGQLLRRATEKDPAARDVTAEGLLAELEGCDVRGIEVPPAEAVETVCAAPTVTMDASSGQMPSAPERPPPLAERSPPHAERSPPLATAPSPNAPSPNAPSPIPRSEEGERRQVTAVCCTLSTAGGSPGADDLEALDATLAAEQVACAAIARRFGGHVGGALSNTLLFFFGYPTAREDDARRAARAALAMIAAVGERGAEAAAGQGPPVNLHVGIHTGLIVRRDGATLPGLDHLGGATSQAAARLAALAQPGEVLVSGETRRLLRGHYTFDPRGAPQDAGARSDVFRLREGADGLATSELPLAGRRRELEALIERWGKVRGGEGQAVLLTGEPGIGKSRLSRALRERLRGEPHTCLEGRCAPDATNSPLHPFVDMFDRLLDPGRQGSPEARLDRLSALLSEHGFALEEALPLFAPLLSLPLPAGCAPPAVSPQKQREMTHDAVLSLIFEMGERAPVVLFVEDLHWADPSTRELAAALVAEAASARVLALFTSRPELSPPWSPSAVLSLQLGQLEPAEVAQMTAALAGGRASTREVSEHIAARTDGVPLFVEELVRTMLESGALVERDGALGLARAAAELGPPSTLRDLLTARLDRLGRAKQTAQVAAGIGREFGFELLRAVLPLDEETLREHLDALVSADLVHRRRRVRNPTYTFKHALVQDTAYDSMLRGRRREIHERIARALERDFPAVVDEHPETLAWHFERAELHDEATAHLLRASQHAMIRSAYVESTTLLSRALELVARSPGEAWAPRREIALRVALGGALVSSRGYCTAEYEANGLRAREVCRSLGEPPELLFVVYGLWAFHLVRGDVRETEIYMKEMSELAERWRSPEALRTAHYVRGTTAHYSQRYEEARESFCAVLSLYDPAMHADMMRTYGDDHGFMARCYLQLNHLLVGDVSESLRLEEQTRALAGELADPLMHIIARVFEISRCHLFRDHAGMAARAEAALALDSPHGWSSYIEMANGLALVRRGEAEAGLARLRAGFSRLEADDIWANRSHYTLYLVEALLLSGHVAEAQQRLDDTIARIAGKLDKAGVPTLIRVKATLLAAAGDRDAAIAGYRQALALAEAQRSRWVALDVALHLAHALAEAGQPDEARVCLSGALSHLRGAEGLSLYEDAVALLAAVGGDQAKSKVALTA